MAGAAVGISVALGGATALGCLPLRRFAGTVFGAGNTVVVDMGTKGITELANDAGDLRCRRDGMYGRQLGG